MTQPKRKPSTLNQLTDLSWSSCWDNLSFSAVFTAKDGTLYAGDGFSVPACTCGTWQIHIKNHGGPLGAPLVLRIVCVNGFIAHKITPNHPNRRDYATLAHSANAHWTVSPVAGFHNVADLSLTHGVFEAGESITLTIGNRSQGGAGSEIYWTETASFIVIEAEIGDELRPIGRKPFTFHVIHRDEVALARLLLPSTATPKTPFHVTLGVFDSCGNVNRAFCGTVHLSIPHGLHGLPNTIDFSPQNGGNIVLEGVYTDIEGTYRVGVSHENQQWQSNPCVVAKNLPNVYWGDLHVHGWGDCSMHLMHVNTWKLKPQSRHTQARDIGRFDFAAVGPMAFPEINRTEIWNAYQKTIAKMEQAGKYIPFLSYEAHPPGEDRTVIFQRADEPMPISRLEEISVLMKKLYSRDDVLMECHIGGATPKWEKFRPLREDLVEIASAFGNAEWLLQHALSCGYRPAVCGCSDLHMGLLGGPRAMEMARGRFGKYLNQRDCAYGTGPLTAVFADTLTRDSLFSAMKARHTYATNGERIVISATLNDFCPGDLLPEADRYTLNLHVAGTDTIRKIAVISGEREIARFYPSAIDFKASCELEKLPASFVYLRIEQNNDGTAWTTPFYIHDTAPRWDSADDTAWVRDPSAQKYLPDVLAYLTQEEDITRFTDFSAVGFFREPVATCAVFRCMFDGRYPMTVKWYFGGDLPHIRLDWGHALHGIRDDEAYYG